MDVMKKQTIIFILLATLIVACKKEIINPEPVKPYSQNQFIYRVTSKCDTAMVWLNNVKLKDSILNYSLTLNKGDTLRFHYYSKDPTFNFAIWHNQNKLPYNVYYFYPMSVISQSCFYPTGAIINGYFVNND